MRDSVSKEYILIFDSGVGGLTVLHRAQSVMPHESFIYYADVAHVPYGEKSKEEVRNIVIEAIWQISSQHRLKAIVLACNTATSVAVEQLRDLYTIPIIGMEPAVKPALEQNTVDKKILILATTLTLREEKLENLISQLNGQEQTLKLPMPELVDAAEEFDFNSNSLIAKVKKKLSSQPLSDISTVVLGCTHFIYYYPLLRSLLPDHIKIIDGNAGTVNRLKSQILLNEPDNSNEHLCYLSGREVDIEYLEPFFGYLDRFKI